MKMNRHTADTAPDTPANAGALLVREMVAQQMRVTTTAIYRVITYVSLWVLVLCSITFAAVQVWALRGYLPAQLPAPAAWTLPVALQVLVLAAELILLSSAVTRSAAVQGTAGVIMVIGYGAEITAHVHQGHGDLVTVTLVVMSVLLALCWTLLALALRAGIADADALALAARGQAVLVEQTVATEVPLPAPVVAPEPQPELWEAPAVVDTADTAPDLGDTAPDTLADETETPRPGIQLSDVEMDAVVHMLYTETDPPRSYREAEARFRELGYVGSAGRLRESWRRVTQDATVSA
jgi:hypothetical protein